MVDQDLVAAAAAAVAGRKPPPAWLAPYLHSMLPTLATYHASMPLLPKREATRLKLDSARRNADALGKLLRDTDVAMFIENALPAPMLPIEPAALADVLAEVSKRARAAERALPADGGRTRARPLHSGGPRAPGMTPALFVALLIAECWQALRGVPLGKGSEKAADAAEYLWNATIDAPPPAWGPVFTEARKIAAATAFPGSGIREATRNKFRADIEALLTRG